MNEQLDDGVIICVVGARPNYMKMAPIIRALQQHDDPAEILLVHTGQHYDVAMNDQLFNDLSLPAPDVNLEVGSASHAVQTAEVMKRFEPILDRFRVRAVVVVGDVNSTLACALVAAKRQIPVVHVEAGLRSKDRTMPEEINRVLTDQLADLLYLTERDAFENLAREGIDIDHATLVGNVMIDSLYANLDKAVPAAQTVQSAGFDGTRLASGYALVTLHRPSNVDDEQILSAIVTALSLLAQQIPLVFALHPRTQHSLERFGLWDSFCAEANFIILPPQGYLEMLGLMSKAQIVLTDSGGIQEETTALGVPCLTIRNNTERPVTVEQGTNTLVGNSGQAIIEAARQALAHGGKRGRIPELWDGKAAERIVNHLMDWLNGRIA